MITVTPQGNVYLCRTPLEKDYNHQLTFTNANAQASYFASTVKKSYSDFVYIRKDNQIVVDENIENIRDCNYLFYRNNGYSDKIFYCFINKMEYVSDDSTRITFDTDVIQTWYFEMDFKRCFVEREHVSDDTIGKHTVPENLETGEYLINDMRKIPMYTSGTAISDYFICFVATQLPYDDAPWFTSPPLNIGGVYTPLYIFAVNTYGAAKNILTVYEERGRTLSEAIINIYMIPSCCVRYPGTGADPVWSSSSVGQGVSPHEVYQEGYTSSEYTLEMPKQLAGSYEPKNNKLFTYPYSYFYIDNNSGTSSVFKWEDFPNTTSSYWSTPHPQVSYLKAIIPSASISAKLFFTTYKNYTSTQGSRCFNYGISFGKVPVCAWTTDYYTNWLTQNGVNMATSTVSSALTAAAGATLMSGGNLAIGAITGLGTLALRAAQDLAKMESVSHTPDQAHGDTNTGDFIFAYDKNSMNFYQMSIRPEYAEIIDNYFSMFGYKVNSVKVPSITGRRYWNYIKTLDSNIEGNIPQEDLQKIRSIFNNGCTFWHGASNMYNYSLNNEILNS